MEWKIQPLREPGLVICDGLGGRYLQPKYEELYQALKEDAAKQEQEGQIKRTSKKHIQTLCTIGYGIVGIGFICLILRLYHAWKKTQIDIKDVR